MKGLFLMLTLACSTLVGQIKTVVFDYGGVVAHADRSKVIDFLKATFDADNDKIEQASAQARKVRNQGGSELGFWEDYAAKRRTSLPDDWMKHFRKVILESVIVDEAMIELIEGLKERKVGVVLLSNIEARKSKYVRELGHYDRFDDVILSCDIGVEKPDPKIYELVLEKHNLEAKECLFVDDDLKNINAAQELGFEVHHYSKIEGLKQALDQHFD